MSEVKYIEKIKSDDSLLSMPQSLSQILTVINNDDFSMEELAAIVMHDPGLTGKVLRMANSAFYRQQARISSVNHALMMLGVMQVKCLALSTSVFKAKLFENTYNIDIKEMFGHFISVALGCRKLAEAVGYNDTEEVFVGGLLHDIGLVFFMHHYPDDYAEVLQNYTQYPSLMEAEKAILGIDHAEIGQVMAEKWNFPPGLCRAIGEHHRVPEKIDALDVVHFVQLSRLINKPVIDNRPSNIEQRLGAIDRMCQLMNIDRERVDEISYSLLTETLKTAEFMGIDIGEPAEVLTRANKELFNSYLTIETLFRERQDLSQRILAEERRAAMLETKNIAIATLSHYMNNAAMAISGRGQLIKMLINNGAVVDKDNRLDPVIDVIEKSVNKILAVLDELRDLSSLDEIEKYTESQAINIDDRIKKRLLEMESGAADHMTDPTAAKK
jgi:putative nucleotidyltransferase with HDIG domain